MQKSPNKWPLLRISLDIGKTERSISNTFNSVQSFETCWLDFGIRLFHQAQIVEEMQGSCRVLLKSTCAFLCFFFTLVAFFFPVIFWKVLFFGKNVLFSVEPPIFSPKYHYFEGFGHKETDFFFKICYSMFISLKKFQPCFTRHKVHSLYLLISIYTFG